jgi:hypothetical protein
MPTSEVCLAVQSPVYQPSCGICLWHHSHAERGTRLLLGSDMPSVWSNAPIPLVLGETIVGRHEKWLWSPDDVFRTLKCWAGEWNKDYENWFQAK